MSWMHSHESKGQGTQWTQRGSQETGGKSINTHGVDGTAGKRCFARSKHKADDVVSQKMITRRSCSQRWERNPRGTRIWPENVGVRTWTTLASAEHTTTDSNRRTTEHTVMTISTHCRTQVLHECTLSYPSGCTRMGKGTKNIGPGTQDYESKHEANMILRSATGNVPANCSHDGTVHRRRTAERHANLIILNCHYFCIW